MTGHRTHRTRPYWPGKAPANADEDDEDDIDEDDHNESEVVEDEGLAGSDTNQVARGGVPIVSIRGGIVARAHVPKRGASEEEEEESEAEGSSSSENDEDESMGSDGGEDDKERVKLGTGNEDYFKSDEIDELAVPVLVPVFVTRQLRETILEKEAFNRQEQQATEKARDQAREVAELARKELMLNAAQGDLTAKNDEDIDLDEDGVELPDDEDHTDQEEEEHQKWRLRELMRMIRDRDEKLKRLKEKDEREERRKLTEVERQDEDQDRAARDEESRKNRPKMAYLQKYYHKGAFFMEKDEKGYHEPIYDRNFLEPTAEEKFDKALLARPMQVRRGQLGMAGRSKYTHLVDQDTTRLEMDPLAQQISKRPRK
mmetsp:Transcript_18439/g.38613  ORF Transcript_18439/g.38613 Transcript_18439/m.38613 type:complete len:372 (-) Transcript_18439:1873-2988(-)